MKTQQLVVLFALFACGFANVQQNNNDICGETEVKIPPEKAISVLKIPKNGTMKGPATCVYNYEGPSDTLFSFKLTNLSIGTNTTCKDDYVTVGNNESDLMSPRFTACGSRIPEWEFFSKGNKLTVKLEIKSHLEGVHVRGQITNFLSNLSNPTECGHGVIRIKNENISFSSPVQGQTFSAHTICHYLVIRDGDGQIGLKLQTIKLGPPCDDDFISISDQDTTTMNKYCKSNPPTTDFTTARDFFWTEVNVTNNVSESSVTGLIFQVNPEQSDTATTTINPEQSDTVTTTTPDKSSVSANISKLVIGIVIALFVWNR